MPLVSTKLIEFTKKSEGEVRLSNGNHKLYKCPADKYTIGYGFNIEDNGLPEDIAEILINRQLFESKYMLSENVNCWLELSAERQDVLIDMCYNMGWPTLSKFKKMFAALEAADYNEPAEQMKDSKWYRDVDVRAEKLILTMKTNEWHER